MKESIIKQLHDWWLIWRNSGPAERLIIFTARRQWRLVAINLASSLLEAFSEGAALAIVFMAIQVVSPGSTSNWTTNPIVNIIPGAAEVMNQVPRVPLFIGLLGVSVLLQLLQSLSRYINALSVGYLAARCRTLVTKEIHSQILRLTYPCASEYRVGDLVDVVSQGPEGVRITIEASSQLLVHILMTLVYLSVLVTLSPWLMIVATCLAAVVAWVQKRLLPRIRRNARSVSEDQKKIASQITEHIQALRLLHTIGGLADADRLVSSEMAQLEQSLRKQYRLVEIIGPLTQLLPVIATAVIGGGSVLFFGDKSTGILPSLITFVLSLQRLNIRMGMIAGVFTQISSNSGRLKRLDDLLKQEDKQFVEYGKVESHGLKSDIKLRDVYLRYANSEINSLVGINMEIRRGKRIALVGTSGAGKSSIADLLIGLYKPTSGKVEIDGTDLQKLDLRTWQRRLGVVSQDTFLFNCSIGENIAYGCTNVSSQDVIQAAEAAQALGFINRLPRGLNTLVGERGYRLSGGQRQRISLARAILRSPDLLILDEATSALDSHSERLVQQAIENLPNSTTVLIIAHRLSTISKCDEIYVLQNGQVEQKGTHEDLIRDTAGIYSSLWRYQASGS